MNNSEMKAVSVYYRRFRLLAVLCGLAIWLVPATPSRAQYFHDSLIVNDLTTFEEAHRWHSFDPVQYTIDTTYAKVIPSVDIETIQDRASCLELDMPLTINKTVCGFIHFFTVRKRNYTQTMLERKNYYFPIFEYYLRKHQMPDALKYLAIVESGLNFKAKSRTGAVGLWQFMPGTGSDFYLKQNQHLDERQNPYLATEAACKFLKYLYRLYGDWELALAAYNCGPGNVNKAIRRSGKHGFWEIYDFLPKETRSYVPQFHAVVYSMNFAADHNIHPDIDSMLVTTQLDTFRIAKTFDIRKLENLLGMPQNTLQHCNPTLKTHIYPAYNHHPLLVPDTYAAQLHTALDRWIDSAAVSLEMAPVAHEVGKYKLYKAKKGESLQAVADKFQVNLASLKQWNHISTNRLKKAKQLRIYIPEEREAVAAAKKPVEPPAANEEQNCEANPESGYHIVKKGEKLYQVAMQYGRTTAELKAANGLNSALIRAGQKLVVDPKLFPAMVLAEESRTNHPAKPPVRSTQETYSVKKGDRLLSIARKHHTTIQQIRDWNHLKTDMVKTGQVLIVNAETVQASALVKVDQDSCSTPETGVHNEPKIAKLKPAKAAARKHTMVEAPKTYLVQKGDTLYSITKKFARLTVKDLMRINNLKDKKIKPGQQLIIG